MKLNAKATYTHDKEYYNEIYSQLDQYFSKHNTWKSWKRWKPFLCLFLIVFAAVKLYVRPESKTPYIYIAASLFAIFASNSISSWLYLRKCWKWKTFGSEVTIEFLENKVTYTDIYSETLFSWGLIERYLVTPKGLFLFPEKKRLFYIPDSSLVPLEAKSLIIEAVQASLDQRVSAKVGCR